MFGIDDAILGSVASAAFGFLGQDDANDTNRQIADQNNQTSIELANTAYQRKVKDLNTAGLNPMLAYINGSGGSSSGAAVPNLQQAHVENTSTASSQASLNSALVTKTIAEADTAKTQAALNLEQAKLVGAERLRSISTASNLDQDTLLKGYQTATELSKQEQLLSSSRLSDAERTQVEQNVKNLRAELDFTVSKTGGQDN